MQRRETLWAEGEDLVLRGQDAELVRSDRLGEKRWQSGSGEEVQQAAIAVDRNVQRVQRCLENVPRRSPAETSGKRQLDDRHAVDEPLIRGILEHTQIAGEELHLDESKSFSECHDETGYRVGCVVPRHEFLRFVVRVRASGSNLDGHRSLADVGDREDEFVGVHVQKAYRGQFKEEQFESIDRAEEEVDLEVERIGHPREGDHNDRHAYRRPTRDQIPGLDTVASGKRTLVQLFVRRTE